MNPKEHWEQVYRTKAADDMSWYQDRPAVSLKLIEASGVGKDQAIIDVGGGASVLVDFLLDAGFNRLTVLDISANALEHARQRLGALAARVEWFEADVTRFNPAHRFDLWHDRAVFHFLTEKADRQKYVQTMKRVLSPEAHVIIATFALDGPSRCSGLEVARYDADLICTELGSEFGLLEQVQETHLTPWRTEQRFSCFRFRRDAKAAADTTDLKASSPEGCSRR